jgi:hypothetical protein
LSWALALFISDLILLSTFFAVTAIGLTTAEVIALEVSPMTPNKLPDNENVTGFFLAGVWLEEPPEARELFRLAFLPIVVGVDCGLPVGKPNTVAKLLEILEPAFEIAFHSESPGLVSLLARLAVASRERFDFAFAFGESLILSCVLNTFTTDPHHDLMSLFSISFTAAVADGAAVVTALFDR